MVIGWFSCGATSAVACKKALQLYEDVHIFYIETSSGHPDNERFLKACEQWFGQRIEVWHSNKYKDVDDVLLRKAYINGPYGAACTMLLKKEVRYKIQDTLGIWDGQVWGFDFCKREINRAIRFKEQNPDTKPLYPLIELGITKEDALGILWKAGIEIPKMYRLGYDNNNCIGCVKGGIGYWNKIRHDFPDRFQRMAEIERKIGATCLKDEHGRIWLDELDPYRGDTMKPIPIQCGITCEIEFADIMDERTRLIMEHKMNIRDL